MRIIAGDARGIRLDALEGEETRPTLDRVKEGMFSSIQFILPGAKVLDLYAGSGQLGLEALSRGAASCVFVDSAREAVTLIGKNAQKAKLKERCKILQSDVKSFLGRQSGPYDIILLDPPYSKNLAARVLPLVANVCHERAVVLCEIERDAPMPEEAAGLVRTKTYRYGTVGVVRYEMKEPPAGDEPTG